MAVTNQDVQKLYIAYFNRPADYFGLQFQVQAANATSLAAVANSFANSPEFLSEYAGKTDAQFVNALYVNLFGREADLPGLSFWINLLNTGVVTKGTIAIEMLKGAINQDAIAISSKVAAAEAFYAAIDTTAEATAYSGAAANAVAKAFLAGITTPEALAAAIAPATLAATLTAVVTAGSPAPVDTTFNTTVGVDTFLGTVGSDVVNVAGDVTTLNSGDTLAGGNGIDTLNITAGSGINSSLTGVSISGFENVNITGADSIGINAANAAKLAAVVTAQAAKDATAANLTAASNVATTVAATAATAATAVTVTAQLSAAAAAVAALTTEADIATATTASPNNGAYTNVQYNAAAVAAQSAAGGATLITVGDDSGTMTARADALAAAAVSNATAAASAKVSADAAVTAANTQVGVAATADVIATANLNTATAAAVGITVASTFAASSFVGATAISMDGAATSVTGLTAQNLTLTAGANVADTLKYTAAATAANIGLSSTGGTLTLQDNSATTATTTLTTLNLSGSSKASAAGTHTVAGAGAVTIVDQLNATAGSIKTANIAVTNATNVNTISAAKLTTIDASASTGAVTLTTNGAKVSSITTGTGADIVTIATATSLTDLTKPAAVTVSTGAGNDIITVATTGTGTTTISAGEGNDTVALSAALNTSITVDGGAGNDSLSVLNVGTFGLSDYLLITAQVKNVEAIKFAGASEVSVDAASMAQFNGFTFISGGLTNDNAITKVADAQTLTVVGADLTATAASYNLAAAVPNGTGTLTVNAVGGTGFADAAAVDVTVNANAAVLNVTLAASTTGDASTNSFVNLKGDVTTATINLTSAANWAKAPTGDVFGNVSIDAYDMANLESVTLTGNGRVVIDNDGGSITTVNAAALTSVLKTGLLAGTASGDALTYYASADVAETIILGTGIGHDVINNNSSTFAKMDTITNFKLTADGIGGVVAGGDTLNVNGNAFVAAGAGTATALAGSTFGAVLTNVGLLAAANVVFQFGGDTYVYSDINTGTGVSVAGLDAGDIVIKLTGLIDSSLLASVIVAS
jgi:hypothetical protein